MLHKQVASEMWPPVILLIKVAFGPCAVALAQTSVKLFQDVAFSPAEDPCSSST